MTYGYKKKTALTFPQTVAKIREELAKEGFGILTEIDVKATLKKKLDVAYDNYLILGACNPPFAYKALQTEKDIGLLMPCNVIVYEETGSVWVSAILPTVTASLTENPAVITIAKQVEEKLKLAIDRAASSLA